MTNANKNTAGSFFSGGGPQTSPLKVEKWLNSLPYANVHHACSMIYEALEALNRQPLKHAVRKDLIDLFADAYLFMVATHLRKRLRTNLHALRHELKTAAELRRIAMEIAFGCKQVINAMQAEPQAWRKNKTTAQVLFQATRFLSHGLLLSYTQYLPAQASIWKELHQLYVTAAALDTHDMAVVDEEYPDNGRNTVEHTYKKILLTSLIDPYHLQYRSVWNVFDLLHDWAQEAGLESMRSIDRPPGFFVVEPHSEMRPVPYIKFEMSSEKQNLLLLDANPLVQLAHDHLAGDLATLKGLGITNEEPESLLQNMERSWSLPPKRYFPRSAESGTLEIACGLNAVHYFLGGKAPLSGDDEGRGIELSSDGEHQGEEKSPDIYNIETWNVVNKSSGGYAVSIQTAPANPVRVGDLIGIVQAGGADGRIWSPGVIRWLMIPKDSEHRLGIQVYSSTGRQVTARDISPNARDDSEEVALLIDETGSPGSYTLITSPGRFLPGARLSVNDREQGAFEVTYVAHEETTVAFDRITIKT